MDYRNLFASARDSAASRVAAPAASHDPWPGLAMPDIMINVDSLQRMIDNPLRVIPTTGVEPEPKPSPTPETYEPSDLAREAYEIVRLRDADAALALLCRVLRQREI